MSADKDAVTDPDAEANQYTERENSGRIKSFLEDASTELGEDTAKEMAEAMETLHQRCIDDGLPERYRERVKRLIQLNCRVWKRRLGTMPPVNVPPLRNELKPGAEPVRCSQRKYTQEQCEFLDNFIGSLLKYNFIVESVDSKWASPVLVVKKPDGRGFRMVIDLREVNARTISTTYPMPYLESIVRHLAKSKFWFSLDAFKGFWLMPLHADSQEVLSFQTHKGVYKPLRALQGHLNASAQFQQRMHLIYGDLLWDRLICWIDDLFGHAETIEQWFQTLSKVLELAEIYGLFFQIDKCRLFQTEAKFCGRIFTKDGVSHDPLRVKALTSLSTPRNLRILQSFIYGTQWMNRMIPNFQGKMLPLTQLYERLMANAPKRTRKVARQITLEGHWLPEHQRAFEDAKETIAENTRLAYPDPRMVPCLFGDAADESAAGFVTQIPPEDVDKHPSKMRHQPLGFWSHKFTGSQTRWNMTIKEAFALKETMVKLDYCFPPSVHTTLIFTDHKNLLAIYAPDKWNKPTAQMLERWTQVMQTRQPYRIVHIRGEDNYLADVLSRWDPVTARVCRITTRSQTKATGLS